MAFHDWEQRSPVSLHGFVKCPGQCVNGFTTTPSTLCSDSDVKISKGGDNGKFTMNSFGASLPETLGNRLHLNHLDHLVGVQQSRTPCSFLLMVIGHTGESHTCFFRTIMFESSIPIDLCALSKVCALVEMCMCAPDDFAGGLGGEARLHLRVQT
jgi:hypothetical protein